jgi:LysM repeat protein
MNKRLWVVMLVILAMVAVLPACTKSASQAPLTTPTSEGALPFPLPVTEDAMTLILTQTAVAAQGTSGGGQAATATQQPPAPTVVVPPTKVPPTFTPLPVVVVPTATPGLPTTYTLQSGEWPLCIARRFNLDASELLALNGLTMDSLPAAGTVLKIPQTGNHWAYDGRSLINHPATYTIKTGDTIYKVACAYGDVDPNAIIAANGLKSPYSLTAGQTLRIP